MASHTLPLPAVHANGTKVLYDDQAYDNIAIALPSTESKTDNSSTVEKVIQLSRLGSLKRSSTLFSLMSDITLVDSDRYGHPPRTHDHYSSCLSIAQVPKWLADGFLLFWFFGVLQIFHQWLNATVGYIVLRATLPSTSALASALDRVNNLFAVMRTGALGGFVTHVGLVWTFSLLLGCCIFSCGDEEPPREMNEAERRAVEMQIHEEELERRSKRTPCSWLWERLIGAAVSFGRAAGAAAVGAVFLQRMDPAPMSAGYASVTSVVGAAVLYAPRTAVWYLWRTVGTRCS